MVSEDLVFFGLWRRVPSLGSTFFDAELRRSEFAEVNFASQARLSNPTADLPD
jgi:hypothetical protein